MKKSLISDAITDINPDYVEQASDYKPAANKHRHTRVIAALVAAVILTASAFAAGGLLTASDIANRAGETTLAEYFENGEGEAWSIEPQTSGGYTITILGIASGDDLSTYDEEIGLDKTYIVGSIERADGEPITDYTDIMVSPVVSGYEPWLVNIFTLSNGSRCMFIEDGVEYFLVETTNVTIFADHTVYIAAYSGALAPTSDMYTLNIDGTISIVDDTITFSTDDGDTITVEDVTVVDEEAEPVKVLFELPLDPDLADPEAAEALIASIY
ncbi:MAG: hypothetical protein LUG86_09200 [Oscillospiraceae bacterium]|nr:hypothetical protein [Oscillospiraceae bacterium]